LKEIVSSTERSGTVYGRPLPPLVGVLLHHFSSQIRSFLTQGLELIGKRKENAFLLADKTVGSIFDCLRSYEPHLLICGRPDMGQKYLGPFVIDILEKSGLYVKVVDVSTLLSNTDLTPEAYLFRLFHELKRQKSAALFIYDMNQVWEVLSDAAIETFKTLLYRDRQDPIILAGTTSTNFRELNQDITGLFAEEFQEKSIGWRKVISLDQPDNVLLHH
jgi:SpoVK/Ycf46/Vps4 family AAA+-type ATPase